MRQINSICKFQWSLIPDVTALLKPDLVVGTELASPAWTAASEVIGSPLFPAS